MATPEEPVVIYAVGLCYASACTEASDADTVAHANSEHPTGLRHGWQVSTDATFAGGEPNPCPCHEWPETRRHVLLEC